jgi:hypothetical protein
MVAVDFDQPEVKAKPVADVAPASASPRATMPKSALKTPVCPLPPMASASSDARAACAASGCSCAGDGRTHTGTEQQSQDHGPRAARRGIRHLSRPSAVFAVNSRGT